MAAVVDLEGGLAEDLGGELEAHVAVQVVVEVLGRGVVHVLAFWQADELGLLSHHVDGDVAGQAVAGVGDPLDDVSVLEGAHAVGGALVADLGVGAGRLVDRVLRDEVAHLADGAAAQAHRGGAVDHGHAVHGDLCDVLGELAVLHVEQLRVALGVEEGAGDEAAHHQRQGAHGQDAAGNQQPRLAAGAAGLAVCLLGSLLGSLLGLGGLALLWRLAGGAGLEGVAQVLEEVLDVQDHAAHAVACARDGKEHRDDDHAVDDEPPKRGAVDVHRGDGGVVQDGDDDDREYGGYAVFLHRLS